MTLMRAALAYARQLRWPVFPLHGKVPAIPKEAGGQGVHDATLDEAQIRRWWMRWPDANIGIACGSAVGFWVLDIDADKGGIENLAALEAAHGALPPTVEAVTGSGGKHLLFRLDGQPVKNRANRMKTTAGERLHGLDTRATGGYIVAAPSVHPETGVLYQWRPDRHPLRHGIADAPAWLLDMAAPEPERAPTPVARYTCPPSSWGPKPAYAQAALDAAARAIAQASPGQQEMTLNAEAYSIGRLIGAGLMPEDFARSVLIKAGTSMSSQPGKRPWAYAEIEKKVSRAIEQGKRHPREARA
jgi:hypothetical protein